jgi:hypothetical protein
LHTNMFDVIHLDVTHCLFLMHVSQMVLLVTAVEPSRLLI